MGFDVKVTCGEKTIIDRLESQWDDTIVKPTDVPVTGTFTIEIPVDYISQSKNASYEFTISAYQYNASVSAPYSGTYNIVGMKRAVDNYYDGAASYIEVWSAEGLVNVINDYDKILDDLSKNVYGHKEGVYLDNWQIRLLNDLDFNSEEMKSLPFPYGSLDGQGHTIKNVKIVDNDVDNSDVSMDKEGKKTVNKCVGLFKKAKPISNLNIDTIYVESSVKNEQDSGIDGLKVKGVYIGAVAGYTTASWTNVHVKNITVISTESTDNHSGAYVGGLVGNCYGSKDNCTVSKGTISGGKNLGGFAGYVCEENKNSIELKNCAVSDINIIDTEKLTDRNTVGSFAGRLNNVDSSITLTDCTVSNITGDAPTDRIYGDIPNENITINGTIYSKS